MSPQPVHKSAPAGSIDSTHAEVRVEVSIKGLLSMCPTTSAGLPKQTHSMTVFLPQRLGLESFLWAQAKSGEPQNGLAGSCRPSGQILTSLLRYHPRHLPYSSSPWVPTSTTDDQPGACEIVSLRESACLIFPERGNKGCAGCCTCAPAFRVKSRHQQ